MERPTCENRGGDAIECKKGVCVCVCVLNRIFPQRSPLPHRVALFTSGDAPPIQKWHLRSLRPS
jgi:hypothetical protein